MMKLDPEKLQGKIDAVNELHGFVNEFVRIVQSELLPFRLNKPGNFCKKDEQKISEIKEAVLKNVKNPRNIRCWYDTHRTSITWRFDTTYPVSDNGGVEYYEIYATPFERKDTNSNWTILPFRPLETTFNMVMVLKATEEQSIREKKIQDLQDEIDSLIRSYRPFLERRYR